MRMKILKGIGVLVAETGETVNFWQCSIDRHQSRAIDSVGNYQSIVLAVTCHHVNHLLCLCGEAIFFQYYARCLIIFG